MSVYTDALLAKAQRGVARNVAAVRVATRSLGNPRHPMLHKREKRPSMDAGTGVAKFGDRRTSKGRADYRPAAHEVAMLRSLNIPANTYHNIVMGEHE